MSKKHYGGTTADGKGKGAVITVTVIILALIIALVAAIGSYGFTQKDFKKWFNGWGKGNETLQPDDPDTTGDGSGENMVLTPGEEKGLRLMTARIAPADYEANGISAQAETAYVFSVTGYDENHSSEEVYQEFEFTAAFNNPSSEWATGKNVTEYINLNVTSEKSATVTCLQAFEEPVTVKAKSKNSDAFATRQCDYVSRVTRAAIAPSGYNLIIPYSLNVNSTYVCSQAAITYGVGTVRGNVIIDNLEFKFTDSKTDSFSASSCANTFIAINNSIYFSNVKQNLVKVAVTDFQNQIMVDGINFDNLLESSLKGTELTTETEILKGNLGSKFLIGQLFMPNTCNTSEKRDTFFRNLGTRFQMYFGYCLADVAKTKNNRLPMVYNLTWHYDYNGTTYSSSSTSQGFYLDLSSVKLPTASSVEADQGTEDNFIF